MDADQEKIVLTVAAGAFGFDGGMHAVNASDLLRFAERLEISWRARRESAKEKSMEAKSWSLDQESAKFLADLINGGDEPTEVTLCLGHVTDDDGKVQYGLLVYESEYPEEGASLLVECEPPSQLPARSPSVSVDDGLLAASKEVLALLRRHPSMQGREYVSLGIAFNNAIQHAEASKAEQP